MADWDDPTQRAAVWYVAAFGALASVLLAGTQISHFEWERAAHPVLSVLVVAVAVCLAVGVVVLAARVLTPRFGMDDLLQRQRDAETRLQARRSSSFSWADVAAEDEVLSTLYTLDGFSDPGDSPISLRAAGEDPASAAEIRAAARARAAAMVTAANRRASRTAFSLVRYVTPVASLGILACTLAWPSLSAPAERVASAAVPIPVRVVLADGRNPAVVVGRGCSLRTLAGVAVSGDVAHSPLVALPDQGDCPAKLLRVDPTIGSVTRVS